MKVIDGLPLESSLCRGHVTAVTLRVDLRRQTLLVKLIATVAAVHVEQVELFREKKQKQTKHKIVINKAAFF